MTTLWIPETAPAKHLRCHLCKQNFPMEGAEPSPVEMREFSAHVKGCWRDGHDERVSHHITDVKANPFLTAQDSEKVEWFRRRRG